ncbi:MAG: hypothetical protein QM756_39340 [Polyangiaceae bacterium]
MSFTANKAVQLLAAQGYDASFVQGLLERLQSAGIQLADNSNDELVCRWVNVMERAVPPDADTIIRTITRTRDGSSTSTTHWLDGLRGPQLLP